MESDFGQAAVSFARKTGLFFSEGIFEEGQLGEARRIPLPGFYSGMVLARTQGADAGAGALIRRFVEG